MNHLISTLIGRICLPSISRRQGESAPRSNDHLPTPLHTLQPSPARESPRIFTTSHYTPAAANHAQSGNARDTHASVRSRNRGTASRLRTDQRSQAESRTQACRSFLVTRALQSEMWSNGVFVRRYVFSPESGDSGSMDSNTGG